MEAYDVVHGIAALALALFFVRALQALTEHYFPQSEPAVAMRYLFAGP